MIVVCTDFGAQGPYVGQMEAAIEVITPGARVIKLFSDLPAFNPKASAYLLAAYTANFPEGTVFLCVVDPGVGTASRDPVILQAGGRWFVGPDNGLFDVICKRAVRLERWRIDVMGKALSASFHGRDLFAPVAATIACGQWPRCERIVGEASWGDIQDDLWEIIYIDHYGNAVTGIRAATVELAMVLEAGERSIRYHRVFGEAPEDQAFWYENSNGLVEIAWPKDSAAQQLGLRIGDAVRMIGR